MFKQMIPLKQERLPLAVGGISWLGLTGLLFEMAHIAWLLALSLSFFPSLFLLFTVRFLFLKSQKREVPLTEIKRLEQFTAAEPVEVLNPNFDRFLTDFSHILEMQKQYWEIKTSPTQESVCVSEQDSIPFSVALKEYGKQERAFALWQNYKKSVLDILRRKSSSLERDRENSVEKLNYRLSEREFYLFCPHEPVRDAIEEVKFFLQAIKKREKELEEIIAYLEKAVADGIWLSAERKQKIKEYQKNKEICQKQLEKDTEEILRNLEEIFTSL